MEDTIFNIDNLILKSENFAHSAFALSKNKKNMLVPQQVTAPITFNIKSGEIAGIISSQNSITKSLINNLLGFSEQTSGTININGKAINNNDRSKIGVVVPSINYNLEMSLYENLVYLAKLKSLPIDRVEKVIEMLDMQIFSKMKMKKLLPNFQKTSMLAQALINNPDVLIISDIFAFLSAGDIEKIWQLILKLSKEFNLAVLIVFDKIVDYTFMVEKLVVITQSKNQVISNPLSAIKFYKQRDYKILTNKPEETLSIIKSLSIECELKNKKVEFLCDEQKFIDITKSLAFAGIAILKSEQNAMNLSKFCTFLVNNNASFEYNEQINDDSNNINIDNVPDRYFNDLNSIDVKHDILSEISSQNKSILCDTQNKGDENE